MHVATAQLLPMKCITLLHTIGLNEMHHTAKHDLYQCNCPQCYTLLVSMKCITLLHTIGTNDMHNTASHYWYQCYSSRSYTPLAPIDCELKWRLVSVPALSTFVSQDHDKNVENMKDLSRVRDIQYHTDEYL